MNSSGTVVAFSLRFGNVIATIGIILSELKFRFDKDSLVTAIITDVRSLTCK